MIEDADRKVYKVTELTRLIRETLEVRFGHLWVEGELSNVRRPSSGHYYFTIKDESAQISAVLFRGNQRRISFEPTDGVSVRVFGEISVYERGGNYQLIVRRMEEWGKGVLQARFEALKKKLREEGLFDEDRKQPLPLLPQHVGVVTSPTGAAIRDILNVVGRRFPNLHIVLAPVKVQGERAAAEIAAAIDLLNERGELDVLIAGRGGGSLEDLWCFNEEIVARAIARSRIPVIAAIGHEIDFTISDFVADLRAPTPSSAAELVVGKKEVFEQELRNSARRIAGSLQDAVRYTRERLLRASQHHVFRQPGYLVQQYRQRMDGLDMRMRHELRRQRDSDRLRLDDLGLRTVHEIRLWTQARQQQIRRLDSQMAALNPLAVLRRGYSVTRDMTGAVLRRAAELRDGQRLLTRLAEGTFESEVVGKTGGTGDDRKG